MGRRRYSVGTSLERASNSKGSVPLARYPGRITNNKEWSRGGHVTENAMHILRDCHIARQIWEEFKADLMVENSFLLSYEDWVQRKLRTRPNTDQGRRWIVTKAFLSRSLENR